MGVYYNNMKTQQKIVIAMATTVNNTFLTTIDQLSGQFFFLSKSKEDYVCS